MSAMSVKTIITEPDGSVSTRRFQLPHDGNLDRLQALVKKINILPEEQSVTLHWQDDDGDWITLGNEADLEQLKREKSRIFSSSAVVIKVTPGPLAEKNILPKEAPPAPEPTFLVEVPHFLVEIPETKAKPEKQVAQQEVPPPLVPEKATEQPEKEKEEEGQSGDMEVALKQVLADPTVQAEIVQLLIPHLKTQMSMNSFTKIAPLEPEVQNSSQDQVQAFDLPDTLFEMTKTAASTAVTVGKTVFDTLLSPSPVSGAPTPVPATTPTPEPEPTPTPVPTPEDAAHLAVLPVLLEMGFQDNEITRHVVIKHKGSLNEIIEELTN